MTEYCAPMRREGEADDNVYDGFEDLKENGMRLRAAAVALEIYQGNPEFVEDFSGIMRVMNTPGRIDSILGSFFDKVYREHDITEYGMREKDKTSISPRDVLFARMVQSEFVRLFGRQEDRGFSPEWGVEKQRNELAAKIQKAIEEKMNAHAREDIPAKTFRGALIRIERYLSAKNGKEAAEAAEDLRFLDDHVVRWVENFRKNRPTTPMKQEFKTTIARAMNIYRRKGLKGLVQAINEDERSEEIVEGKRIQDHRGVQMGMNFFGKPYVPGTDPKSASKSRVIRRLAKKGVDFTYAREREGTGDDAEATHNYDLIHDDIIDLGHLDPEHRHMSLKLTSIGLSTYDGADLCGLDKCPSVNKALMKGRLRDLVRVAQQNGVFVRVDMEQFIYKDATFEIFFDVLEELVASDPEYANSMGIVFQTYLEDSPEDADAVIARANELHEKYGVVVDLRVVKGANRRKDMALAEKGFHEGLTYTWYGKDRSEDEEGWSKFVSESPIAGAGLPDEEAIIVVAGQMLDIMGKFMGARSIRDCYGTHNPNTIAHIKAKMLNTGTLPDEVQIQGLMGVDNPLKFALAELGFNGRVYVPYEDIALVAEYLWRRFEEYTGESTKPSVERQDGEWRKISA